MLRSYSDLLQSSESKRQVSHLLFRVVWSVMVVFDEGPVEVAVVFEAGVFPGVADGLAFFDAVVGVAEAFGDEVLVEGVVVVFLEDTIDG